MKKRCCLFFFSVFFVIVFFLIASSPFAQAKSLQLKMVMFLPDIPPGNIWTHMFMDKVKAISNGSLTIRLIGGPEAIPASDAPIAAQKGVVDIANVLHPYADTMVPGLDALSRAEYSPAELRGNGTTAFFQEIFAKSGLYYLGAAMPSGAQMQTCFYLKKEISSIDDLKDLKIASAGGSNRSHIEGLGAVCVPINFPDYFTAMERGVVDGYNVGVPGIQDFGLTPVTGCMLDETFSSNGGAFIINLKRWDGLSQEFKDVLTQAAVETEIDGAKTWDDIVAKVKTDIEAAGVKIIKLSKTDSIKFYKNYRDTMGAEDLKRHPDNVAKLQKLILNSDFYRLK